MPKFLRRRSRTVRDVLEDLGLSPEEIDDAEAAGTDELLAIDGVVLPERGKLTIEELAVKVGTDVDVIRAFWRGLGFVDPVEGERLFGRRDVAILKSVVGLMRDGLIDPDLALQVVRVLGVSMAQVATAVVDASEARSELARDMADHPSSNGEMPARGAFAVRARELLPFLSDVIDYSFRRHLRAAARRRVDLASSVDGVSEVVGFADLVRFTELSMRLDEHDLATVVGRFDEMVNRIVVEHQGRIVKMIGDAAMFTVVDPTDAALIALDLAEAVDGDDVLSGVRIGMARGPALSRDGDLYGPVVNLASRLGTFGRSSAINVSQELRDAIAPDPRFSLRSLGLKKLRHIGEVRVYRLRPGPERRPAAAPG